MKNQTNPSPIEWKEVQLKEIAMILMGQSPPGESYNKEGRGIPFFQGKAEFTEKYPKIKKWTTEPSKLAEPDSILMSVRAPVGDINFCNIMCCIGRGLASIKPKKDVSLQYLYFIISKSKEKIAQLGTGSTFKAVNANQLSSFKIPIPFREGHPDLETQKAIVSILEKAEQLKEKRKQALKLLDEYVKSTFNEMFVGKGFEEKKLNQVAEIVRESINPSKIKDYQYYIGLEHIESETGRVIDKIETKAIDLKSTKFLFDEDCILYGKLRPYLNKIAIPNFKGVCSTDIIPIREIKNISNKYYLAFLLRQKDYVNNATSLSIGANLPRLSPRSLESFKIPLPPLPLQQTFASLVEHVEKLKEKQTKSLKEIEQLFNALMQKAFNGELV